MKPLDLAGERFGALIAVEPVGKDPSRNIIWKCRCDCGGEKNVPSDRLRSVVVAFMQLRQR